MEPHKDSKNFIALLAPGEKGSNIVYVKRSTLKWNPDGTPVLKAGWSVATGKKG